MFGDILSDQVAGLVGGLGFAPGANIGTDVSIFEAVHGSAPDIAGKGVANPTAVILAGCLMLEHLGEHEMAKRIGNAVRKTVNGREAVTGDLGGDATTQEYTDAVIANLG